MDQPIINSNSNDKNEELIHPTNNYINIVDNNVIPPNDEYYIDQCMNLGEKKIVSANQIVRTEFDTFSLLRARNIVNTICYAILFLISNIIIFVFFRGELDKGGTTSYIILGVYDFIVAIALLFYFLFSYDNIYLTLEPYSIKITKKARIRTKIINYNIDELEKAGLYYNYRPYSDGPSHVYLLYLINKSGKKDIIYRVYSKEKNIQLDGLKFFVDLLNNHIIRA